MYPVMRDSYSPVDTAPDSGSAQVSRVAATAKRHTDERKDRRFFTAQPFSEKWFEGGQAEVHRALSFTVKVVSHD
jgi:hypothetical protein